MKKNYIAPSVEINETMASQMMALSLLDEPANSGTVLGKEENSWNIWADNEDED